MTRFVITDPGTAAHSAKNKHAAPGLPNQSQDHSGRNPMVGTNERDQAAQERERVLAKLRAGREHLETWANLIRQGAEQRVGSMEAEDVVQDATYAAALDLYGDVCEAVCRFAALAPEIERGER